MGEIAGRLLSDAKSRQRVSGKLASGEGLK